MRRSQRHRLLLVPLGLLVSLALWTTRPNSWDSGHTRAVPATPRIPKILHLVSESELVFSQYSRTIRSCLKLNPDWTYILWRDSDAGALISKYFPRFYSEQYINYKNRLQKSDSIRYIVLYLFGGVYIDMDVECRKPFFPALANEPCFLDQEIQLQSNIFWDRERTAMNSVMGCRPGHPFMLQLISRMMSESDNGDALVTTGPLMLTKALDQWQSSPESRRGQNLVRLCDPEVFSPYLDNKETLMKHCQKYASIDGSIIATPNNGSWIGKGCRRLMWGGMKDKFSSRTIAVHWYFHLGWYSEKDLGQMQRFNISRQLGGRLKLYNGQDGPKLRTLISEDDVGLWFNGS